MVAPLFGSSRHFLKYLGTMSGNSGKKSKQMTLDGVVVKSASKKRCLERDMPENSGAAGAAAKPDGGFELKEEKGDLFTCPETSSLAHCISADVRMGKGIAVLFKKHFKGVQELIAQGQKPGGCAVLLRQGRYIYYLVTKEKFFHKPTYDTLRASLQVMKKHCKEHDVKNVCMPQIGCGLDQLQWPKVVDVLNEVFGDTDMTITVYIYKL